MARFTVSDLKQEIDRLNNYMILEEIPFKMVFWPRNGMQAVDLYHSGDKGKCARNVGCGTSREVSEACRDEYQSLISQKNQGLFNKEKKEEKTNYEKIVEEFAADCDGNLEMLGVAIDGLHTDVISFIEKNKE